MISEVDKVRISQAISRVERLTSGEIFCVVTKSAGGYRLFPIAWAAALALLAPAPMVYLTIWASPIVYLFQLLVFLSAAAVLSLPSLSFRIVCRRAKHDRAHAEAMRQFFAQGLDKTQNRTGVLIFAAEGERYAEIVADAGINEKVTPAVWDDAIAGLVAAIKDDRAADGFLVAIERCGAALALHFPPGALDRNELPDKLLEL